MDWLDFMFILWAGATAVQMLVWATFLKFIQVKPKDRLIDGQMEQLNPNPTSHLNHPTSNIQHPTLKNTHHSPKVTILICARNAATELRQNLSFWLEQHYPIFEVLVVDDDSEDDTQAVLAELGRQYSKLRTIRLSPKKQPGKKAALTLGVQTARYPWIALTDADCTPASPNWLYQMMSQTQTAQLVLGYGPSTPDHRYFFNRWIRFETAFVALQYTAFARAGLPYMGVGRNLVWHRGVFDSIGGFAKHAHIPSGDDDLLVQAAATKQNKTTVSLHPDTWVYSPGKTTLRSWLAQKRRHLGAGNAYKPLIRYALGGIALTHTLHYGLGAILLVSDCGYGLLVLLGYVLRLIVVWPTYRHFFNKTGEQDLCWQVPLWDGMLAVYYGLYVGVVSGLKPKETWLF
jgi:poly-beta-1,6-N-acetyl-D-glucosamine synthase